MNTNEGPTFQEILIPIWVERKKILITSLAVALVTLGVNFLLPVYYKSTATLLPETQKDKLSSLGQFADIASLAGVSVPGSEIARLYPTIVNSESILRNVVLKKYSTMEFSDSVNLIQIFGYTDYALDVALYKTLTKLRSLLESSYDNKTSVVSLSVEMPEPQLSSDVLNGIVGQLDRFMRFKKLNNASEQVKWIEIRLKDVLAELRNSEDALRTFNERNRRVSDSPELMLAQQRILREVQVNSTVFVELKKQYELAKLDEIKNITIVNVLDSAVVPVKKERPRRLVNSVLSLLFTIILMSSYTSIRNLYGGHISTFLNKFRTSRSLT
jgi:tyrosine-protein kinase Etk/Wzc